MTDTKGIGEPEGWASVRYPPDEKTTLECRHFRIYPNSHPMGDDHHTDVAFAENDVRLGHLLAWFMGTLFSDVGGEHSRYWYHERTSADEWSRVARALRIHGLTIVMDKPTDVPVIPQPRPVRCDDGGWRWKKGDK